MISLIIFIVIVIGLVLLFNVDFTFLTLGFENVANSISSFSSVFFNFFKNIFIVLFNQPTLFLILSIGLIFLIIDIIVDMLGGRE